MNEVTVVIPTIPPRWTMLARACGSVSRQSHPAQVIVSTDLFGEGAALTRNKGLMQVETEWVAFLDDDDEFFPNHLELLLRHAEETDADLVYPNYDGINTNLFWVPSLSGEYMVRMFDRDWDEKLAAHLRTHGNFIPVTVLARTKMVKEVGGFQGNPEHPEVDQADDWRCWIKMLDAGARFSHLRHATWRWNGHPGHTSGRRWTTLTEPSGSFQRF